MPLQRSIPRRGAAHTAGLLAAGLTVVPGREPSDSAADSRDVLRRPVSQGSAGRVRIPAAIRARQPAAQFRGMGETRRASTVYLGNSGCI